MVIVRIEDVSEPPHPALHKNFIVVIAELLQQCVQFVHGETVVHESVGEQQHQVLDLEHETGVSTVSGVSLER